MGKKSWKVYDSLEGNIQLGLILIAGKIKFLFFFGHTGFKKNMALCTSYMLHFF